MREIEAQTPNAKLTQALWGPLNKAIYSVSEDCSTYVHDSETGELLHRISDHQGPINSLSFSPDEVFFLTCSDDRTAKVSLSPLLPVSSNLSCLALRHTHLQECEDL